MKSEKISWSQLGVFICTKCKKEIDPHSFEMAGEPDENLKVYLKKEIHQQGLMGKVRIMTSSCLGTCPKGEQAIAFINSTDNLQGESSNNKLSTVWIGHPERDRDNILHSILENIK